MPLGSAIQRNDELFNQDDDEDFDSPISPKNLPRFSWSGMKILFHFAETVKYWDII